MNGRGEGVGGDRGQGEGLCWWQWWRGQWCYDRDGGRGGIWALFFLQSNVPMDLRPHFDLKIIFPSCDKNQVANFLFNIFYICNNI